jgi:hypothetical protein
LFLEGRLRGATPGRALLRGDARRGPSEEGPLGETPVRATRRGPSEEGPPWEALIRAGSEVKAWLE